MEASSEETYHDTFTDKEKTALEKFKTVLAQEKQYVTPDLLLNDDKLILFLRARKLDISKSKKMIINYLKWYSTNSVEDTYRYFTWDREHEFTLFYPHGFHKTAKSGEPIYLQVLGSLNVDEIFKMCTLESIVRYSTKQYEIMERDIFPICSRVSKRYIHSIVSIIDLRKIGKQLLNKKVYALIQVVMNVCQNYYPESLGSSFIINTGFVFKALYTMIKPFLDKKTRSKIKILGKKYHDVLYSAIDKENLPDLFGGECKCEPQGCLFSFEGPWKKGENGPVSEDIMKRRKEMIENIRKATLKTEDGKEDEGNVNIEP